MKDVSSIIEEITSFILDENVPIEYRYYIYSQLKSIIERRNKNEKNN